MIDNATTPKEAGKVQFFLTGFAQAAGIRTYAFQGRIDASRIDCTVEVDLALLPGYGIRIQDLPLLCRELLQQHGQTEEASAIVFTEQRMRNHAEKLAAARLEAEQKKKQPKHLATAAAGTSEAEAAWRPHLR